MKKNNIVDFIVILLCIIIGIICFAQNHYEEYKFCFLYPICFSIIYLTYFRISLKKEKTPFKLFLCLLLFIRYVFLPFGNTLYGFTSISQNTSYVYNYHIASFITIIEIALLNIFLVIQLKKKKNNNTNNRESDLIKNSKKNFIIVLFIIIMFSLFLSKPNLFNSVYFIYPKESISTNFNSLNDWDQLIVFLFNIAKQFLCLIIIEKMSSLYMKNKRFTYFIIACLFALINIVIYTGTNRAEFVITVVATGYLIITFFPKYKKYILFSGITLSLLIVPLISTFRNAKIVNDNYDLKNIMVLGNAYFSGIDNVALSIETANNYSSYRNLNNCLYDLSRGIIGIGFFIKNQQGILSSRLFNYSFFGNYSTNTSQIMPMSGQGYFYFGIVGFWIIELFFIMLAIFLEKKFVFINNLKLKYFLLIYLMRLAMFQCLNGTILFNRLSYDLIIPIVLIAINNLFVLRRSN